MTSTDVTFELSGRKRNPRKPWLTLIHIPMWAWMAPLVAYLIALPFVSEVTELRQSSQIAISVLAVLGVNIATGYGGMISLGHGVFVGAGAFSTAYYVDNWSLPWLAAIALGAITAGLVGALVGLPALRVRGIHLALITLCLAIAFQPIAKRFPALTGGVSGKSVAAAFDAPDWWPGSGSSASASYRYVFCLVVIAVALLLTYNVINSRVGRSIRATRDDPTAAAIYGISLWRTRVATFGFSAGLAGLAGALGVVLVPFVSQSNYPPQESLILYATAVIGGLGVIWGSVLGVIAREALGWIGSQLARIDGRGVLSEIFDLLGDQALVFGFGLIVLTFVFPRGLAGLLAKRLLAKRRGSDTD